MWGIFKVCFLNSSVSEAKHSNKTLTFRLQTVPTSWKKILLNKLTLNARRRNVLSSDWLTPFSAGTVRVGYQGTARTSEPKTRPQRICWKYLQSIKQNMWLISKTCQNENGSCGLFWSKHTWTSWMRYWESLSSVRYFSRHFTANSLTIGSGKLQSNNSIACSGLIAGQSFRRQYIWNEKRAAKYRTQILNNPVIHSCIRTMRSCPFIHVADNRFSLSELYSHHCKVLL